jgi:hypothetical protein
VAVFFPEKHSPEVATVQNRRKHFFLILILNVLFTIMAYKLNVALQYSYKSKKIKMHKIYKYKLLNLSHIIHTSKDSKSKKLV